VAALRSHSHLAAKKPYLLNESRRLSGLARTGSGVSTSLVRRSFCVRLASKRFATMMCEEWGTPGREGQAQARPEGG
jgi:hypothetical protein